MGTREERATRRAELARELQSLEDEDDDLEIAIEREGTKTYLKGRVARKHLRALGLDDGDDGDDAGDGKDPKDGKDGKDPKDGKDGPATKRAGYFK